MWRIIFLPSASSAPKRTFLSFCTPIAFLFDYLSICAGSGVALLLYNGLGGSHVGERAPEGIRILPRIHDRFYPVWAESTHSTATSTIFCTYETLPASSGSSSFCLLLLTVESFFSKMVMPRLLLVLSWALITLFVLLEKHAVRGMFARWKVKHNRERQVLILGAGSEARRIFSFPAQLSRPAV